MLNSPSRVSTRPCEPGRNAPGWKLSGCVEHHAYRPIAQIPGAGDIGADEVALHHVVPGPVPEDGHAEHAVARDEIAFSGSFTADGVAGHVLHKDAESPVAQVSRAGDVGAQVTALDEVAAFLYQADGAPLEAVDGQPFHGRGAGLNHQSFRTCADPATVQFDQRRAGETRLAGSVENKRIGDKRQRGERGDGVGTGSRNGELNGVVARTGVRLLEGGAQGAVPLDIAADAVVRLAVPAVVGGGDDEAASERSRIRRGDAGHGSDDRLSPTRFLHPQYQGQNPWDAHPRSHYLPPRESDRLARTG